jgi:phage-related holin
MQQYRQFSSFFCFPQKIGTQVGVVTKVTSAVMVSFSTVAYKLNPLALVKVSMLVDLLHLIHTVTESPFVIFLILFKKLVQI